MFHHDIVQNIKSLELKRRSACILACIFDQFTMPVCRYYGLFIGKTKSKHGKVIVTIPKLLNKFKTSMDNVLIL